MKSFRKELSIIFLFALLHAIMTVFSRWQGLSDHLMLTTLTMLMTVVLCRMKKTNVNTMILVLVIVNFAGFYLARFIGRIVLHPFIPNTYVRGALAVSLTTIIIGLAVIWILTFINKSQIFNKGKEIGPYWLLLGFTTIIIARLALVFINNDELYKGNITLNVLIDYAFCCMALLYLAIYSANEARKAQEAKEKSNIAQYSYIRLQQQVKPHFMFNNLNILNSLICEERNKEASDFVYKLAYLYRYMIENEDEKLVPLYEELDFVHKYTELMKVRFESSFIVKNDVEENVLGELVIPCSIQMMIENAIKHNGGTDETPLTISITNTDTHIVVRNNRLKKTSYEPSTRFGLKYIKKLYYDLSSKEVLVDSSDEEFVVSLPIINSVAANS